MVLCPCEVCKNQKYVSRYLKKRHLSSFGYCSVANDTDVDDYDGGDFDEGDGGDFGEGDGGDFDEGDGGDINNDSNGGYDEDPVVTECEDGMSISPSLSDVDMTVDVPESEDDSYSWFPPSYSVLNQPCFKGSKYSLLDIICAELLWFSSSPSISKEALTMQFKLKKQILPTPNTLPDSYEKAIQLVSPYYSKKIVYDVCEDDCIVFSKENQFLETCSVCGKSRYNDRGKPRRTFVYFPIKERLLRLMSFTKILIVEKD